MRVRRSEVIRAGLGGLVVLLALSLLGCRHKRPPTTVNILRYPLAAKPLTLDPGKAQDEGDVSILSQVYEGLVAWSEQNKLCPALANSWEVSDDKRTYTFRLRPDGAFSNGRVITADDFKWCLTRNCRPGFHSQTAPRFLADIVGAADMMAGKRSDIPGLAVLTPTTLAITIDRPRLDFVEQLARPVAAVFAKEALADPDREIARPAEMVGSGPFRFQTVEPDREIDLRANIRYRDGRPRLDRIERPYVPVAPTRLAMFKGGSLDLIRLDREELAGVRTDPILGNQVQCFSPDLCYLISPRVHGMQAAPNGNLLLTRVTVW